MRIGLAMLPRPVPPLAVVRWGNALAVLAAAAIWWQPDTAVAVTGFVVLGGALAGVFPALISLTPVRLGERARNVISWQVGAAAAGGAGISAVIGLLIGVTSLAVLGPALTVLALIVVAAELLLHRLAPPGRSAAPTPHRVNLAWISAPLLRPLGLGEFEVELASVPPGDGGVGGEAGLAEDG